jgi:hypothetical protein
MKRMGLDLLMFQRIKAQQTVTFIPAKELIQVVNAGFPTELLEKTDNIKRLLNGTLLQIKPWVETGVPF